MNRSVIYERFIRPALFRMDAERAHEAVAGLMSAVGSLPFGPDLLSLALGPLSPGAPPAGLETEVLGLRFPNPIGLAAGFDKDCRMARSLPALGFGFLELGSITLKPQPGNPRPRMFRIPSEGAVINRLGFNSRGAEAAAARLSRLRSHAVPLGVNLGLNADCPKEEAPANYARTFELLREHGDYFVVNVSSPNTTGLRALQERRRLEKILAAIQERNTTRKPVLVKIDPDLPEDQLPELVDVIARHAAGVIASNTTTSRPGPTDAYGELRGGLSGLPLRELSTRLVARIYAATKGKLPIIGAGGVFTGADAYEKIRAGASLVQLYTGLIYRGPAAPRLILGELSELLRQGGFKRVAEAVGAEHR